ncbi:outer membrane beta-barrel protein [Xanthobacter sp. KR7-225]|uniref:outer membrane protein n=1 Tax=Xanthobacter sp. KR7-225 TaxID=3156613 RepID=UPI0032B54B41
MWVKVLPLSAMVLAASAAGASAADPAPRLGKAGDFSLASPEVHEGPESGWYLRGDVGYVAPRSGAVTSAAAPLNPSPDYGAGWSFGGGFGYSFSGPFRVEGTIDYFSLGSTATVAGDVGAGATVGLASLYWDVGTFAGFTPYLGGGIGYGVVSLDAPAGYAHGNDWGFAYSVSAGVSYAFSSVLSMDLGYRYVNLGSVGAPMPAGSIPLEVDGLSAHQVRLGLRYSMR